MDHRGLWVSLAMRSLPALLPGLLAAFLSGCGECSPGPIGDPDWSGETDEGTAIGCYCACGTAVTCYETTAGTCSLGTTRDLESGTVTVDTTGGTFVLTDSQVSELVDTCGSVADTACDTAG